MKRKIKISDIIIHIIVIALGLACLLPLLNMVAISFSNSAAATAGRVGIIPVDFTLSSYEKLLKDAQYWRSLVVSFERTIIGTTINILLVITMAYPLSKSTREFHSQKKYMGVVLFAMLFNGGMIPTYLVVNNLGLCDSLWSLILPSAVGHWNDYFSGILYISKMENYPLQSYIQSVSASLDISRVTDPKKIQEYLTISEKTLNAAKIVVSTLPLMIVYPFVTKYFKDGIVVGAVKE